MQLYNTYNSYKILKWWVKIKNSCLGGVGDIWCGTNCLPREALYKTVSSSKTF